MNHADAEVCSECAQNGGFGLDSGNSGASSEEDPQAEDDQENNVAAMAEGLSSGEEEEEGDGEGEEEVMDSLLPGLEEEEDVEEDAPAPTRRSLKRNVTAAIVNSEGEDDAEDAPARRRDKLQRRAAVVKSYAGGWAGLIRVAWPFAVTVRCDCAPHIAVTM